MKQLSLCIPTNGIIEWVFPVLDSIFSQKIDEALYEVIVTDNGQNELFEKRIEEYCKRHPNLLYRKTTAVQFLNQIEAFKMASGKFIKFVNHRTKLLPGSLDHLISFVKKNEKEKPSVFFSNGAFVFKEPVVSYESFDQYVRGLSYWSSWSGGLACWKKDFDAMPSMTKYNDLFPHITILFNEREKQQYIIDNSILFEEISVGNIAKGRYNLFFAFSVEYIGILCDLLRNGDITKDTFLYVKKKNENLLIDLYWEYLVLKKPCSYDLTGVEESLNVFYSYNEIRSKAFISSVKRIVKKMRSFVRG